MKKTARQLAALAMAAVTLLSLSACGGGSAPETKAAAGNEAAGSEAAKAESGDTEESGEKKVLRVAMECAYAPYNWSQPDDSNGAVPSQTAMSLLMDMM